MKPDISSFVDYLVDRINGYPNELPSGRTFFTGGDLVNTLFPQFSEHFPTDEDYRDRIDPFFTSLRDAVGAIESSGGRGRSYLLWIKWGHDDEGDFPPLDPATAKEDTFPLLSQPYKLNQSWELIQYKFRTEIAPRGGGSGGAGNVVFWFAPPTPTLRYAFDGPQAGSDESYGYTS